MYKSNRRKTGKRKLWLLCAVLLTGLVSGCSSTQETVEETGGYYGRDCVMYDGCLYWNSGVWYDGQQKALPEDALQVGEIAAAADAVPEGQLESALLPAGTQVYASESEKSLFIRQDGGYVQYQPMEGMQEEVEEVLAVRPTGEVPGYEYVEADCIYYSAGQMKCLPRIFTAQPAMRGTWSARATVIREGFWSGTGREMYGSCTRPGIPMRMSSAGR